MQIALAEPGAQAAGEDGPLPVTDSAQELWVDWSTYDHTGAPTPVTASGPGAEAFEGDILNTQVFTGMMEAMGVGG
jgi:alkaline phosphatase